ncbi:hypothetical protein LXL04_022739 [Taraxacum kok-saghyz]
MKENIPAINSIVVRTAPSKAASTEFVDFDRDVVTFADCGMAFCVTPFDCGPNGSEILTSKVLHFLKLRRNLSRKIINIQIQIRKLSQLSNLFRDFTLQPIEMQVVFDRKALYPEEKYSSLYLIRHKQHPQRFHRKKLTKVTCEDIHGVKSVNRHKEKMSSSEEEWDDPFAALHEPFVGLKEMDFGLHGIYMDHEPEHEFITTLD